MEVENRVWDSPVFEVPFAMFFGGGDPFEQFGGHGGGGRARRPAANVDTTKLYETLGVSASFLLPGGNRGGSFMLTYFPFYLTGRENSRCQRDQESLPQASVSFMVLNCIFFVHQGHKLTLERPC